MNPPYRAVIVEVDPEFFRIELQALREHLTEIGLPPIAVYDPECSWFCTICGSIAPVGLTHSCRTARTVTCSRA